MLVPRMLALALLAISAAGQSAEIHAAGTGSKSLAAVDSCVTSPLQDNCTSYQYPVSAAAADLNKLCGAMHFMSACSVAKACNASGAGPDDPAGPGAAKISSKDANICQPFNHVATICKLDSGMSRMSGCNNINTMCVAGSKVPICSEQTGLADIPTSETVNTQVRSICEEMTMDGCEKCMPNWQAGKKWGDCDLLDVYSYLCYQMPEMGQCTDWHSMCKTDPTLKFCYGTDGSGGSSGGGGAPGPVMKMYFFEELPFYLLFKSWTPRNRTELCAAWFAVFALGLLYEFLQMIYGRYETRFWTRINGRAVSLRRISGHLAQGSDLENGRPMAEGVGDLQHPLNEDDSSGSAAPEPKSCCSGRKHVVQHVSSSSDGLVSAPVNRPANSVYSGKISPVSPKVASLDRRPGSCSGAGSALKSYFQLELVMMDVVRGIARFILAGLAYLLMLAAMSYHVAIFFAVITGVGVGSMLFGRWRFSSGTAEGYSHCGCGSS